MKAVMGARLYVGMTDNDWFHFLAEQKPDEVNFWRPGGKQSFAVLTPGDPFLFKLHSPDDYIVGGGHFVRFSRLPVDLAWEVFGIKNGAATLEAFRSKILSYRRRAGDGSANLMIGCIILTEPFFFEPEGWFVAPEWHRSIVQGKGYDLNSPVGASLLAQVSERLNWRAADSGMMAETGPRYGEPSAYAPRLGQGGFRVAVMEAYYRRCAVTGEKVLAVLEASHIKPYSADGPHAVNNGILLRSDIHQLFDRGYATITEDHKFEVSKSVKQEFDNGREYYQYHCIGLQVLPGDAIELPSREFVRWHNEHVYLGWGR